MPQALDVCQNESAVNRLEREVPIHKMTNEKVVYRRMSTDLPRVREDGRINNSGYSVFKVTVVNSEMPNHIATGIPNSRKLPVIPTAPRVRRTRHLFAKLKEGLTEWIELQTNLLQQAELDQDRNMEQSVAVLLSRLKQRLKTISFLEYDYTKYYKLLKQLSLSCSSRQHRHVEDPPLLQSREFSKSALVLTSDNQDGGGLYPPTKLDYRPNSQQAKYAWGSSVLNLLRLRSRTVERGGEMMDSETQATAPKRASSTHLADNTVKRNKIKHRHSRFGKSDMAFESNKKQEEFFKQQLCHIESQAEYLSGTLKCEVTGISGPCDYFNKDEFKVTLKHGPPILATLFELNETIQNYIPVHRSTVNLAEKGTVEEKWVLHGRVNTTPPSSQGHKDDVYKDRVLMRTSSCSNQTWDNPAYVFSPAIDSVFTLKIIEIKRLGKSELLQHQAFDLLDLLKPKCYEVSVNLKHNGRVRFNFLVEWSPLADTDDLNFVYYMPTHLRKSNSGSESKQKHPSIRLQLNARDRSTSAEVKSSGSNLHSTEAGHVNKSWQTSPGADQTPSTSTDSSVDVSRTRSCTLRTSGERIPTWQPQLSQARSREVTIVGLHQNHHGERHSHDKPGLRHWISMPDLEEKNLEEPRHKLALRRPRNSVNNDTLDTGFLLNEESDLDAVVSQAQVVVLEPSITSDIVSHLPKTSTGRPSETQAKPAISERFRKIYYKLSLLQNPQSAFPRLLQRLKLELRNLEAVIEQTSLKTPTKVKDKVSKDFRWTDKFQASRTKPVPVISTPESCEIGKVDTLTQLWESFAFLDEKKEGRRKSNETSSISSITPLKEDSTVVKTTLSGSLSSGCPELDNVIDWHLNYVDRLLSRLGTPNYSHENMRVVENSFTAFVNASQMGLRKPLNLARTPIHAYFSGLALAGQTDVLRELSDLVSDGAGDPYEAMCKYVLRLIGKKGPEAPSDECTRLMEPLVWSDMTNGCPDEDRDENRPIPRFILRLSSLQTRLVEFYSDYISSQWPNLDVQNVVETLLEDLCDIEINGETQTTIPLTQLKQRLKLSAASYGNSRTGDNFNNRLLQVLSYLAGQSHVQMKLRGPTASQMLSALPYFKRSYQTLFGLYQVKRTNQQMANAQMSTGQAFDCIEFRQLPLIAGYSTKTWMDVVSLIDSTDSEVSKKAVKLLYEIDRQMCEVAAQLRQRTEHSFRTDQTFELPMLFSAGPPIHCTIALMELVAQSNESTDFFPPLWTSMVWGIEQQTLLEKRRQCLRGLALLLEQQHRRLNWRAGTGFRPNSRSETEIIEALSVAAGSMLVTHLSVNDLDKEIREIARRVLRKLKVQTAAKQTTPQGQQVRMVWGRLLNK
ncbi:hypothetical protein CLF_107906 [Clonorchis sinensis]|uniref:Uncharacterized protein n=1 Tax=Clonorchis sinensis TaxID=79923 RepID=G7YHB5_CLOSI|nr:hypothetical protein CLF_107906 [Clonorchis sinensis]